MSFGEKDDNTVKAMLSKMSHRGPDGSGVFRIGNSMLGHRRLAIIDVEGGAQPMWNERYDLAVTFNGEIYNHLSIRAALEDRHRFKTRSDTEILVHGFEDEGADLLGRLDGMFAIAWAGPHGLLLARDAIGIKPLYYGKRGDTWLAASELKAFPPMDELTMLTAGHAWTPGKEPWRFALPFPPEPFLTTPPLPEILKEIRSRLEKAVIKRLISDVPVGVYLSGGLDSSVVAALMRPYVGDLHSFATGMEGSPDLEAAREVAKVLGTVHHELTYTVAEIEKSLPEVIGFLESFDAPLVRSAVPMYFVSKIASQHVKVVLSGEGADELFAGYSYLEPFSGQELKNELAAILTRLQDTNLQRADRMSMAHGLEARVPFLDLSLVRYVSRIPADLLATRPGTLEKWLLREACRGLLPSKFLERKKMKFSEGAGSSDVMKNLVADKISTDEFERERGIAPGIILRSPEELYYYRIWKDVMPKHIPPSLVGRTKDATAAAF